MPDIRLNKQTKTLKVVNRKDNIRLQHTGKTGPTGLDGLDGIDGLSAYEVALQNGFVGTEQEWLDSLQGEDGPAGQGAPTGGLENQVLQKASDEDYDYKWLSPTFSDKTHIQNFSVTDTVIVEHNLNKYPAVTVMNSADDEVLGDVTYIDQNTVMLYFKAPFSGRVTCN